MEKEDIEYYIEHIPALKTLKEEITAQYEYAKDLDEEVFKRILQTSKQAFLNKTWIKLHQITILLQAYESYVEKYS